MMSFSAYDHGRVVLKRLTRFFGAVFLACIAASCANIVSPSGGPKDVTPPVVVEELPKSGSVNFTGNSFTIRFDEFVQLGNLQQQILISPPLNKQPTFQLRGKSLKVSFSDTLHPNTTYAFHFGDALRDITESNQMAMYSFYFSTGAEIDQHEIRGKVLNAWDQKLPDGVYVVLFPSGSSDSAFAVTTPTYVTRPDKSGGFVFQHIASGTYHLAAVADLNNNMRYDLPNEAVAFESSPVISRLPQVASSDTLNDSLAALPVPPPNPSWILRMFTGEDSIQKILSARSEGKNKAVIALRYPVTIPGYRLLSAELDSLVASSWNQRADTLTFWLNPHHSDTLSLMLDDPGARDTIHIPLRPTPVSPRAKLQVPKVTFAMNFRRGDKIHPSLVPVMKFNMPLIEFDTLGALFIADEDTMALVIRAMDSVHPMAYQVLNPLGEKKTHKILIPSGACKGWDGSGNDSLDWMFIAEEAAAFGVLMATIIPDSSNLHPLLLLLTDEKLNVLETQRVILGSPVRFGPLKPGNYLLKIVEDKNGNGRWDTGDYWKRVQPEKVAVISAPVTIRANWDEELEWKIEFER
jgi:uncharacterized protein (DUF2141 family)